MTRSDTWIAALRGQGESAEHQVPDPQVAALRDCAGMDLVADPAWPTWVAAVASSFLPERASGLEVPIRRRPRLTRDEIRALKRSIVQCLEAGGDPRGIRVAQWSLRIACPDGFTPGSEQEWHEELERTWFPSTRGPTPPDEDDFVAQLAALHGGEFIRQLGRSPRPFSFVDAGSLGHPRADAALEFSMLRLPRWQHDAGRECVERMATDVLECMEVHPDVTTGRSAGSAEFDALCDAVDERARRGRCDPAGVEALTNFFVDRLNTTAVLLHQPRVAPPASETMAYLCGRWAATRGVTDTGRNRQRLRQLATAWGVTGLVGLRRDTWPPTRPWLPRSTWPLRPPTPTEVSGLLLSMGAVVAFISGLVASLTAAGLSLLGRVIGVESGVRSLLGYVAAAVIGVAAILYVETLRRVRSWSRYRPALGRGRSITVAVILTAAYVAPVVTLIGTIPPQGLLSLAAAALTSMAYLLSWLRRPAAPPHGRLATRIVQRARSSMTDRTWDSLLGQVPGLGLLLDTAEQAADTYEAGRTAAAELRADRAG